MEIRSPGSARSVCWTRWAPTMNWESCCGMDSRWLFPEPHLRKVGDKQELGRQIMGMNQGDLPSFENLMTMGYEGLEIDRGIKHMIVFSDGDPGGPSDQLMNKCAPTRSPSAPCSSRAMPGRRPVEIADKRRAVYNITNPAQLPQIFLKETPSSSRP